MTPEIILARTGIDVSNIEQGDEAWHRLRLGVITASEVHNVISKPRSGKKWTDMKMSYFLTLLAEVCTGVAPEVNARALAWGKQYEDDARTLFEFTTDVKVTGSPILFRDEDMRTACSPDGLCSDGRGLELKCPFTSRDFMKFRLGGFEAIKSAYMAQVQFSMWVTGRDAWYFANYDPRMKREGIHHVVVERDDKYLICKTDCIAAVKNPIHNQSVNAVDVQEDKACQSNNVPVRGTVTSLRLVEAELDGLLGQRTKGKRRNSMIS